MIGRAAEQHALAQVLEEARRAMSGSLVLSGEAGIGKTTLFPQRVASVIDAAAASVD